MKKLLFLLLPSVLVMSSCAAAIQGTNQSIAINSTTQGAKIYVDGDFVGDNSVNVKLKRNRDHTVVIKKDGFQAESRHITSKFQAKWLIPDILLLCLMQMNVLIPFTFNFLLPSSIGIIVDAETGAWFGLSHNNISVDMSVEREQKK